MNSPHSIARRWSATLLILAAWFMASNHCALGLMQGARACGTHTACCSGKGESPAQPHDKGPIKECCKAIHATLPSSSTETVTQPVLDFVPATAALCDVLFVPRENAGVFYLETGPPREARTFAELVLKRSLRSHAPPTGN